MARSVNAGARLDRLPISSFHYRIFWLIGAGMFFDGYDLYVGAPVLGSAVQSKFSTLDHNAQFFSLTFLGMTFGALFAGILGDHYGRRFTYQFNLVIFGLSSLAAACAPDIATLNWIRFVMGLGLGAEIVVGYSTMTEFVPPASRGRWMAFMAFVVVAGLPATAILGNLIIPNLPATATIGGLTIESFNWRPMFVIAGIGALIVWYLRKRLPESPRWLETQGRWEEAEALMETIEREAAAGRPLPPPAPAKPLPEWTLGSLLGRSLLPRMIVGCVVLITINTLIFGFVNWIPTFFVKQGLSVTKSLNYTLVIDSGSLIGCAIGAFCADFLGRRWTIIGSSLMTIVLGAIYPFVAAEPWLLLSVGFFLIIGIYILTALLYGVYTAELFATEVRLRANGICNTFGRGATIVSPFIIVPLFTAYGVGGVLGLMIGLLVIQIIVVAIWGIEPAKRGLEELDGKSADAATLAPARPY